MVMEILRRFYIFNQVCEVLNEMNDVTKRHTYSLALNNKAGKWYRVLKPMEKLNIIVAKANFIRILLSKYLGGD